ncbi:hypothetical protein KRX19_00175 [Cardiobacteriaceae bacterium TAE3-ERU3]|nr:hypothetical protein [Cardiobacteriaceae bacterium TAE3-ERU3]
MWEKAGMWIAAGAGFCGSLLAFVFSFIPPSQISVGSPVMYVGILVALTAFFVALPFVIYAVKKDSWRDPQADFAPFTWEAQASSAAPTATKVN